MGKRFDLLVFDWDGTVIDSAGHIVESIQAACQDLELAVPSREHARYIIGLGLADAMAYLVPDLAPSEYPRLAERYRHHYLAGDHQLALFEGVRDGLAHLHAAGFLLAVATGKSRRGLDRALQDSGLQPFFHLSRCADEGFPKPHPEMLVYLMEMLGVAPTRTLMIGDTSHDLEMARAASVTGLAVTYGAHDEASLRAFAPVACIASSAELVAWLRDNA